MHEATVWRIETSSTLDLLCLVGILTGDAFYADRYPSEYERLSRLLTTEARSSLKEVRELFQAMGMVVPAALCLSASEGDLTSLASVLERPMIDAVRRVLTFMEQAGFEADWELNTRPLVEPHIEPLRAYLSGFNIIPRIESKLGSELSSDEVIVDVLHYNKPHGMRLDGNRFITNWDYEPVITLRIAIHEMMHPPFEWHSDDQLRGALAPLAGDGFFMERVTDHNPSFGYTTFEGFVEEDCIQALDQVLAESFGVADDPRNRWRDSDDGMHVLAIALYQEMRKDGFLHRDETLRDYLVKLGAGPIGQANWIESRFGEFYPSQ